MAIPSTFALIKKSDFVLTPIKVHKKYTITEADTATTSSGYVLHEGYYSKMPTAIGSDKADNDPINAVDGTYKHIIWQSIYHRYYKHPYDLGKTFEGYNNRYIHKTLYPSCSVLSIPYMKCGERIQANSVNLVVDSASVNVEIRDDGNGNLYRVDYNDSGSFIPSRNIIGYWGFNDEFKNFRSDTTRLISGEYQYKSGIFSPEKSIVSNIQYVQGAASGSEGNYGLAMSASGSTSFILTPDRPEFNFDNNDEFTISCWFYTSASNGYTPLITKRGTKFENKLGTLPKSIGSGQITNSRHISSSYSDTEVDLTNPYQVYPYELILSASTIKYRRSDGVNVCNISSSFKLNEWNNVTVSRLYDSLTSTYTVCMFMNGSYVTGVTDSTDNPVNTNALIFGNTNINASTSYNTAILDEVYLCNTSMFTGDGNGISSSSFHTNLNSEINKYNTAIVGNVFYRQGILVLNQNDESDFTALCNYPYVLTYKGTHTIYQYDVLCRIKKGDFNLTLNPTARKSSKSDLLIDDMTGSLLAPYATTVGLYNDKNELLVVGKLGQAIQMREDVDINIQIRFDA